MDHHEPVVVLRTQQGNPSGETVWRTGYSAWEWEVVQAVVVWVVVRLVGAAEGGPPMAGGRPPKPPTQWMQMRRRGRGRPE